MSTKKTQIAELVGKSVAAFIKNADQSDKSKIGPGATQIAAEMVTQFQALKKQPNPSIEEEGQNERGTKGEIKISSLTS